LRRLVSAWPTRSAGTSAIASSKACGTSEPITAADWSRSFSSSGSRSMRAASTAWIVGGTWSAPSSPASR
jgi:hypothetical protein